MKISIAMATYNGAQYIQAQLQSFIDQTRQPDELIITDDCSTDETEAIVLEFAKRAPFQVVFHKNEKNLGYRRNFLEALKRTTGDLIFFSDQDDIWYHKKIESHVRAHDSNAEILVVVSNQLIVGSNLEFSGKTTLNEIKKRQKSDLYFVHGCCTSFKRLLYEAACDPPLGSAHDDWVHNLAYVCGKRYIIKEPLQLFRRHSNNTTSSAINSLEEKKINRISNAYDCRKVAENFFKKSVYAEKLSNSLECCHKLPKSLRQHGIYISRRDSRSYLYRSQQLKKGMYGMPGIFLNMLGKKVSVYDSVGDFFRILRSFL